MVAVNRIAQHTPEAAPPEPPAPAPDAPGGDDDGRPTLRDWLGTAGALGFLWWLHSGLWASLAFWFLAVVTGCWALVGLMAWRLPRGRA
jgi:hypothetical protein